MQDISEYVTCRFNLFQLRLFMKGKNHLMMMMKISISNDSFYSYIVTHTPQILMTQFKQIIL